MSSVPNFYRTPKMFKKGDHQFVFRIILLETSLISEWTLISLSTEALGNPFSDLDTASINKVYRR